MAFRRRRRRYFARHNRRRTVHRRRRHHVRRNVMANPFRRRRRRHYRMNRRHFRRYRRNPPLIAGLDWMELIKGAGAVILSPMLEKHIMPLLPSSVGGTTYGRWAVKLGAALGTWYLAKAAFGARSGEVVAIALGATLLADAAQEFLPNFTGTTAAYLPQNGLNAYARGGLGLVMPGQISRQYRGGGFPLAIAPGVMTGATFGGEREAVFAPPF